MMVIIKLKDVRIKRQLTIRELAELSGISRSQISDIENGKSMPTIETLCRLAKALGVGTEELYKCK